MPGIVVDLEGAIVLSDGRAGAELADHDFLARGREFGDVRFRPEAHEHVAVGEEVHAALGGREYPDGVVSLECADFGGNVGGEDQAERFGAVNFGVCCAIGRIVKQRDGPLGAVLGTNAGVVLEREGGVGVVEAFEGEIGFFPTEAPDDVTVFPIDIDESRKEAARDEIVTDVILLDGVHVEEIPGSCRTQSVISNRTVNGVVALAWGDMIERSPFEQDITSLDVDILENGLHHPTNGLIRHTISAEVILRRHEYCCQGSSIREYGELVNIIRSASVSRRYGGNGLVIISKNHTMASASSRNIDDLAVGESKFALIFSDFQIMCIFSTLVAISTKDEVAFVVVYIGPVLDRAR